MEAFSLSNIGAVNRLTIAATNKLQNVHRGWSPYIVYS